MKKRKNLPECPVETTLSLIGDKWKILIIRELSGGTKRFGELRKSVGQISQKVLTENLREMQADAMKVLREAAAMAEDVGERFPETVRDIHDGRAERRLVKGTCSGEEAQALHEEGIPVMPLPDAVSRRLN